MRDRIQPKKFAQTKRPKFVLQANPFNDKLEPWRIVYDAPVEQTPTESEQDKFDRIMRKRNKSQNLAAPMINRLRDTRKTNN